MQPSTAQATVPPRVLTIEDDPSVRAGIVAFLEDSGYRMLEAATGSEGIALFHQERPDVVLCDLRLPGVDGLDVLAVITGSSPDTPVIVVSGAGLMGEAVQALRSGAWDFLVKPIPDLSVLESTVERALERSRLVRKNREYQRTLESVNWRLSRSLEQLRQDEEAGRRIQEQLLPEADRHIGGYRFRYRQFPSMYLCGDFVDYFPIDEQRTGFYMTDVSGHDAAAAFVTVMLKTLLTKYREALWHDGEERILRPHRVLQQLNQDLIQQELDRYCTMFYGILDRSDNRLRCASAGQYPHPVLIRGSETRLLAAPSRPIGLFDDARYETREYELPAQFGLLLASDGILELLPRTGRRSRMQSFLNRLQPGPDLDVMIRGMGLWKEDPLPDDVSFLFVTRDAADA
jgi:serine phosphatase RsbU (regulator of sigma subunit)